MKLKFALACATGMATIACLGGAVFQYQCKPCGFKGEFELGGGFAYGLVTGYCTTCTNFVSLRWNRTNTPPEKIGTVWSAPSGRLANLYPCPTCKKPFLELKGRDLDPSGTNSSVEAVCPRCKKQTLSLECDLVGD